jgi:hypothetical protein
VAAGSEFTSRRGCAGDDPAAFHDGRSPDDEPQSTVELTGDPEQDPLLALPWNHRGTVEAATLLSGGDDWVKRRVLLFLIGSALTAPAHQWLVHEPEPLLSGLAGRRVPAGIVDRLPAMIAELRAMDDVGGGNDVLLLSQYHFRWVAGLLTTDY